MPNSVSTLGRCGRNNIDTPSARPTMAARSALCVRMSMSRNCLKSIPLLLCTLGATAFADELASETPAEAPAEAEAVDLGFISVQNPAFPSPVVHEVPVNRGRKIERADLLPYFSEGK